ncbi:MAG: hypothetical protein HKM97_12130 [Acidimicrobiia bacterium]|nr:hypothetical protein [Acidimicrobiia bacterium]
MKPALLAVILFWAAGLVVPVVLGDGNAMWVRLLGAAGWTYLAVLIARKWALNRS